MLRGGGESILARRLPTQPSVGRRRCLSRVPGCPADIVGVMLSLVASAAGGGWLGMALAERRAAKRILRARAAGK